MQAVHEDEVKHLAQNWIEELQIAQVKLRVI